MTKPDSDPSQAEEESQPASPSATEATDLSAEAAAEGEPEAEEKKSRWGSGRKEKRQVEELTRAKETAEQAQAALQDRLLRLQADFDNFRKRTLREKAELFRAANEDLLGELLPVIDHFELALGAADQARSDDSFTKGVRMVRDQLLAVLGKFGLQPMDLAGQSFDPTRQEAISHLPSDTVPENGIVMQTRRGYLLGDKLLRPAQVVVSRGPAESVPPSDAAPSAPAKPSTGEG